MNLIFATNNLHKLNEVNAILSKKYTVKGLDAIACLEELAETQNTLEGNATQKASYVHSKYKVNCFSDDSGLLIEALENRPGVLSARYAGEQKNAEDNINKVLQEMGDIEQRNAVFKTIISLFINRKETLFEGAIYGTILKERRGKQGFGYDAIFQPNGYNISFAEMSLEQKNKISHRAITLNKLITFLNLKYAI